ncbi:flavin-containing monooxygenase [Microbacterium sp. NPDC056052]|uniref:flavin-containing monooxygenase n=1 Tax=Microbacterium sp. NPDC056052 TaxID=3345695 RepID=UPI0035E096A1
MTTKSYAVIGAGPSGLAVMRALQKAGIDATGYEASHGVGGLWDITNPRSTMYSSAHLISSRTTTEFTEFPMDSDVDYPGHRVLKRYFEDYADEFGLRERFRFGTRVDRLERDGAGWILHATAQDEDGATTALARHHDGVILANGTLAEPNVPAFPGEFAGEIMHTSAYKDPAQLAGRRVLIIGAGNSGCDIAVDAVHHAESADMSVRRGYYFVPRYLFGRPSDTLNQGRPLPARLKQAIDSRVLRAFTGDPTRFGFPRPDYRIYESHPIVNTLVLNHLGQGDLRIRADVERFGGTTVRFRDGTAGDYDLILLATGYALDYPFVDREHLNWTGASPRLFLNVFPPSFNGLYMMGMIEASGIGWQGRYEQAELIAAYLAAEDADPARAARFRDRVTAQSWPDLTGGYRYLGLARMSYYVNKDAYRRAVRTEKDALSDSTAPAGAGHGGA